MKQIGERIGWVLAGLLGYYFIYIKLLKIGCPIRYIWGIKCPGCGMTRAYQALLKGDVGAAYQHHPLFYLVPIMLVVWVFGRCFPKKFQIVFWSLIASLFICCFFLRL